MHRYLSIPTWRMRQAVLALALLASCLSACTQSESVDCSHGMFCPAGQHCSLDGKSCLRNSCGDGVVQQEEGEVCDDGNHVSGDGCSADCKSKEVCGNGILDTAKDEKCDDGNTKDGDGCSADCRSKEVCGNGIVDAAKGEKCDDGNTGGGDGCSADCKSNELCGNGVVDVSKGEKCDDGNNVNGDGCSADCESNEVCGNGIVDTAKGEECDDGNTGGGDGCSDRCHLEVCGNHIPDVGEQCDDGNTVSGDGCRADCRIEIGCGDGVKAANEECDDGNAIDNDDCTNKCLIARCGDGVPNKLGVLEEECDDGNHNNTDGCLNTCKINRCGDGHQDADEACDDGNMDACGTCNATCTERQPWNLAKGYITVLDDSSHPVHDGDLFALGDGFHLPCIYELDKDSDWDDVAGGHVTIGIKTAETPAEIAARISSVINGNLCDPSIDAEAIGAVVNLTAQDPGPRANQRITSYSSGFTVQGMSGGHAGDCLLDTGCTTDADCEGRLKCKFSTKKCAP